MPTGTKNDTLLKDREPQNPALFRVYGLAWLILLKNRAEYHITLPLQIFDANWDQNTTVYNTINPVIFTRYIRVLPQTWYDHISMRVEFYECDGNNS